MPKFVLKNLKLFYFVTTIVIFAIYIFPMRNHVGDERFVGTEAYIFSFFFAFVFNSRFVPILLTLFAYPMFKITQYFVDEIYLEEKFQLQLAHLIIIYLPFFICMLGILGLITQFLQMLY